MFSPGIEAFWPAMDGCNCKKSDFPLSIIWWCDLWIGRLNGLISIPATIWLMAYRRWWPQLVWDVAATWPQLVSRQRGCWIDPPGGGSRDCSLKLHRNGPCVGRELWSIPMAAVGARPAWPSEKIRIFYMVTWEWPFFMAWSWGIGRLGGYTNYLL